MDIDFNLLNSYEDDTLRPYQQDLKSKVYKEWTTKKSVMLQMPTGTGKTKLFCSIIKDVFHYSRDNGKAYKVLVLTHKQELVRQTDLELGIKYGLAHGIIQAQTMEVKEYPVQIASVQTLIRRLDRWTAKDFDFIIVDEAHHIKADSYKKIIKAFDRAKLLGLTATPYRLSGEGFTKEFESLIVSQSIKEFVRQGYLSQYRYFSIGKNSFIQRSLDGIIKEDIQGDYDSNELIRIYDKDRIRAQIVETYQKYAAGKKGIVYTISQEHNKHLLTSFTENGIKAAAIDSNTSYDKRNELIEEFKKGKYDVLLNVNIFSEGFDCPDIEFIQLARPTKSMSMYLQQVGRGLRPHDSKDEVLILDNVGLYNRFGFPSAERNWEYYFKGREIKETKKNFTERSLAIERKQKEKDLSEGSEKVELIFTSNDGVIEDDYSDVLDPGLANEVAIHLYNRYHTIAQKVHKEYFSEYELCKHELGYYYLKYRNNQDEAPQKDIDSFNITIQRKLSRKGGKYADIIAKWNLEQISLFEFLYNKIQISKYIMSIWWKVDEEKIDLIGFFMEFYIYFIDDTNNKSCKYDILKLFGKLYEVNKKVCVGYSKYLHKMFSRYGKGDDYNILDYPSIPYIFAKYSINGIEDKEAKFKNALNFFWIIFDDEELQNKLLKDFKFDKEKHHKE